MESGLVQLLRACAILVAITLLLVGCAESGERARVEEETHLVTAAEQSSPETTMEETTGTMEPDAGTRSETTPPCDRAPERVLDLQYRHIDAGKYDSAYALFAEESKAQISPEQYRSFFEVKAPYSVTDYSFASTEVSPDGGSATVDVSLTTTSAGAPERLQATQELVCETGSWRVVMRDDQVATFAGIAPAYEEEVQYEAPQYRDPNAPYGTPGRVCKDVDC